MDFDKIIDRRGTHCAKWDMMEPLYGVTPEDGLAMWVADTDFAVPEAVSANLYHNRSGERRRHVP